MAKGKMIDLTTEREFVSDLVSIAKRGPVVPVRRGERTRYLQDGQWIPSWLVRLQRRRIALALALLALCAAGWALWRLIELKG